MTGPTRPSSTSAQRSRRGSLIAALFAMVAAAAPHSSRAGVWEGDVRGGWITGTGHPTFDQSAYLVGAGVTRLVGRQFTLSASVAHASYPYRGGCTTGIGAWCNENHRVHVSPVSLGARWWPWDERRPYGGAFVEVAPTALVVRWAWSSAPTTRVVPGVQAGGGLRFWFGHTVAIDVGADAIYSASLSPDDGSFPYRYGQWVMYAGTTFVP